MTTMNDLTGMMGARIRWDAPSVPGATGDAVGHPKPGKTYEELLAENARLTAGAAAADVVVQAALDENTRLKAEMAIPDLWYMQVRTELDAVYCALELPKTACQPAAVNEILQLRKDIVMWTEQYKALLDAGITNVENQIKARHRQISEAFRIRDEQNEDRRRRDGLHLTSVLRHMVGLPVRRKVAEDAEEGCDYNVGE